MAAREEEDLGRAVVRLDVTAAALIPPVLLDGQVRSEPDSGMENATSLVTGRQSSSWRGIAAANSLVLW